VYCKAELPVRYFEYSWSQKMWMLLTSSTRGKESKSMYLRASYPCALETAFLVSSFSIDDDDEAVSDAEVTVTSSLDCEETLYDAIDSLLDRYVELNLSSLRDVTASASVVKNSITTLKQLLTEESGEQPCICNAQRIKAMSLCAFDDILENLQSHQQFFVDKMALLESLLQVGCSNKDEVFSFLSEDAFRIVLSNLPYNHHDFASLACPFIIRCMNNSTERAESLLQTSNCVDLLCNSYQMHSINSKLVSEIIGCIASVLKIDNGLSRFFVDRELETKLVLTLKAYLRHGLKPFDSTFMHISCLILEILNKLCCSEAVCRNLISSGYCELLVDLSLIPGDLIHQCIGVDLYRNVLKTVQHLCVNPFFVPSFAPFTKAVLSQFSVNGSAESEFYPERLNVVAALISKVVVEARSDSVPVGFISSRKAPVKDISITAADDGKAPRAGDTPMKVLLSPKHGSSKLKSKNKSGAKGKGTPVKQMSVSLTDACNSMVFNKENLLESSVANFSLGSIELLNPFASSLFTTESSERRKVRVRKPGSESTTPSDSPISNPLSNPSSPVISPISLPNVPALSLGGTIVRSPSRTPSNSLPNSPKVCTPQKTIDVVLAKPDYTKLTDTYDSIELVRRLKTDLKPFPAFTMCHKSIKLSNASISDLNGIYEPLPEHHCGISMYRKQNTGNKHISYIEKVNKWIISDSPRSSSGYAYFHSPTPVPLEHCTKNEWFVLREKKFQIEPKVTIEVIESRESKPFTNHRLMIEDILINVAVDTIAVLNSATLTAQSRLDAFELLLEIVESDSDRVKTSLIDFGAYGLAFEALTGGTTCVAITKLSVSIILAIAEKNETVRSALLDNSELLLAILTERGRADEKLVKLCCLLFSLLISETKFEKLPTVFFLQSTEKRVKDIIDSIHKETPGYEILVDILESLRNLPMVGTTLDNQQKSAASVAGSEENESVDGSEGSSTPSVTHCKSGVMPREKLASKYWTRNSRRAKADGDASSSE